MGIHVFPDLKEELRQVSERELGARLSMALERIIDKPAPKAQQQPKPSPQLSANQVQQIQKMLAPTAPHTQSATANRGKGGFKGVSREVREAKAEEGVSNRVRVFVLRPLRGRKSDSPCQ